MFHFQWMVCFISPWKDRSFVCDLDWNLDLVLAHKRPCEDSIFVILHIFATHLATGHWFCFMCFFMEKRHAKWQLPSSIHDPVEDYSKSWSSHPDVFLRRGKCGVSFGVLPANSHIQRFIVGIDLPNYAQFKCKPSHLRTCNLLNICLALLKLAPPPLPKLKLRKVTGNLTFSKFWRNSSPKVKDSKSGKFICSKSLKWFPKVKCLRSAGQRTTWNNQQW